MCLKVPIISLTFPGSQAAVQSAAAAAFCESAVPFKPGTVELELKSWEEGGREKELSPSISEAVLPHHLEPERENGAE